MSCANLGNKARTLHVPHTGKHGKITGEDELPMKDDTVRRLEALDEEYMLAADAAGDVRDDLFDDLFADRSALETLHGDAA